MGLGPSREKQYKKSQPGHVAIAVGNLSESEEFYDRFCKKEEPKFSSKWKKGRDPPMRADGGGRQLWRSYSMYGNQLVIYEIRGYLAPESRGDDLFDGSDMPYPHFGARLTNRDFDLLKTTLGSMNLALAWEDQFPGKRWVIGDASDTTIRYQGEPGEHKVMAFKDPSGNTLEFRAYKNPDYMF